MSRQLDVLFVNPDSSFLAYQNLHTDYAAIEPPTWALLLAQSCRAQGFGVALLDCGAERLSVDASVARVVAANARVVCFVMYGQNPNSGTASMAGAELLGAALKAACPTSFVCFVGSHVSALPKEVLGLCCDVVLLNEGVYALHNLLRSNLQLSALRKIRGIGYKDEGDSHLNPPERVVPQERMDIDLPGYAWDLLPCKNRPLDLYRSHFWHAGYAHDQRTPFAAIYTSLGCRFACEFCMINIVNRMDNADDISAGDSPGMRFWSPEFMLRQFEELARMGVQTVRISDEMFFLQRRYFEPLLSGLADRDLGFRMWAYARVDTVNERYLDLFRKAGVGWLALGIEAGNQQVRQEAAKGSFKDINIRDVVGLVHRHGLHVIANYIFGLPDDSVQTMQETLDLALELNTAATNMYPCMPLPGSPLYVQAKRQGLLLPDSYAGYAFLSYECQPLATRHCTPAEVLRFRDRAWVAYHTNPHYLALVEEQFGLLPRQNIDAMTGVTLRRKILGD